MNLDDPITVQDVVEDVAFDGVVARALEQNHVGRAAAPLGREVAGRDRVGRVVSVLDAVAITFGSITAVAALGLILVTAATSAPTADDVGEAVEARIARLVAAGADEQEVRRLVGDAVRLGQQQQNS